MPKAKYQLRDFLAIVGDDCKCIVSEVNEIMLGYGFKTKIQVMKSTGMQIAYCQPTIKTVAGVVLFFFVRDSALKIRIYATNHATYPEVLNGIPDHLADQISKSDNCKKFADPTKCWAGCGGYDFHIRDRHYQKCVVNCFELSADTKSLPHLLPLIKSECEARVN